MIQFRRGEDIFETDTVALVNPVNCVGVMGAGLAKQFKDRYPEIFDEYKRGCDNGNIEPGTLFCEWVGNDTRLIICLPTKFHWKHKSKIEYIISGVTALFNMMTSIPDVKSVSIPKIGCGLGGLDWINVKETIVRIHNSKPEWQDLRVVLYE